MPEPSFSLHLGINPVSPVINFSKRMKDQQPVGHHHYIAVGLPIL